jgi:hypothetical protein
MALLYKAGNLITGLSSDTKPTTNLPVGYAFLETDTLLRYHWDGALWRVIAATASTVGKKYSTYHGYAGNTDGFLALLCTNDGAQGRTTAEADGLAVNWLATATTGSKAGFHCTSGAATTYRSWNPRIKVRQKISATANTVYYVGWSSTNAALTGDNPLDNLSGFVFGKRTADTNWFIIKNDGDATQDVVDTGVAVSTAIHTVELVCDNANSKIGWSVNGAAFTYETTEIPAATTGLWYVATCETEENVAKTLSMYYFIAIQDK